MLRHILVAFLVFLSIAARAEPPASCTSLFVSGQAPALLNNKFAERTQALCYRAYAVLGSGLTRGALWSAEHPTAAGLAAAKSTQRINLFHPDDCLPVADRAELDDYAHSGYDRGHMTPSDDMPDPVAQQQSFSPAYMVPETAQLNRGIYEWIESAARSLVKRRREAYVVTGPAFQDANLRQIGGRVLVPSST